MTSTVNTKYCLKEESRSDRGSEIQLMDCSVIDRLNIGIYLSLTEMHLNHHHRFLFFRRAANAEQKYSEEVVLVKECFSPFYPFIITHKRWPRLSKWVNEISDFTQLRKKLLIPLWGGNPISPCQFRLIIGHTV